MSTIDPTQRFSTRVENYIKYRPTYPQEIIQILKEECALTQESMIADIGSGTGLLTELFLQNGNTVFGIEPNREMRDAGKRMLQNYPKFHSMDGKAESTGLTNSSIDLITAGQAFHWFDIPKTRAEFSRILKSDGWVILIWNDRETESSPFLAAYEQLLKEYATDYSEVTHKHIDDVVLSRFYGPSGFKLRILDHQQDFDLAGLKGRLLSSSYAPEAGHPRHEAMIAELAKIFKAHNLNGQIGFKYVTKIYIGKLS